MGNTHSEDATFNKKLSFLIGPLSNKTRVEGKFYRLCGTFLERNFSARDTVIRYNSNVRSHTNSDNASERNLTCVGGSNSILCKNVPPDIVNSELFHPLHFNKPLYMAQTYIQWKSAYDLGKLYQICQRERRIIYIQPLDDFPDFILDFKLSFHSAPTDFFSLLSHYCRVFFCGIDVEVLPKIDICKKEWNIKKRHHPTTNKEQLLVTDFETTLQSILPVNGLCILGIIWTDLYPSEDLNFVLGQAFFNHKSGIFCFGRFEPKTFDEATSRDISVVDANLIWKLLKVICHETCHLFGLSHCEFFSCLMNASSSVVEALSQPLFLCPVCLHKLQEVCQFNICTRYLEIQDLLKEIHSQFPHERFSQSLSWLEKCLEFLNEK